MSGQPDVRLGWEFAGFLLAAAYNLSIIVVSKLFTSGDLFDFDPLFNRDGCVCVVLWGLAYASMSTTYDSAPYVCLVFALEKIFYYVHWHMTVARRDTSPAKSAQFFYRLYGLGDLAFGVFFFYIFGHAVVMKHGGGATEALAAGISCAAVGGILPAMTTVAYLRAANRRTPGAPMGMLP